MNRFLARLRRVLPATFWERLWDGFWESYWKQEQREEEKSLKEISLHALGEEGFEELGLLPKELRYSERTTLAEAIAREYPFQKILEVGCAYGQNFHVLAPLFPKVQFVGIDKDRDSLTEGQGLLSQCSNIEFFHTGVGRLEIFKSWEFDITYSFACFLYISPQEVEGAVREMLRVTKNKLFLVEQHQERERDGCVKRPQGTPNYWIRDYQKLFERFVDRENILIRKIQNPLLRTERWNELAHIIEIKLEHDRH